MLDILVFKFVCSLRYWYFQIIPNYYLDALNIKYFAEDIHLYFLDGYILYGPA